MATKIKILRSLTTAIEPAAGSLAVGELAVNIADQKLWVGNAVGDPVELLSASGPGTGEANTASSPAATGVELTMPKDGVDLPFKKLVAGAGVNITGAADTVTVSSTSAGDGGFIVGEIKAWNSSFGGVLPPGWYLCDGTNGAPDYRGKLLFAAGSGFSDGAVGGALPSSKTSGTAGSHSHSFGFTSGVGSVDHTHNMRKLQVQSGSGTAVAGWLDDATAVMSAQGNDHTHPVIGSSGTTGSHSHSVPAPDLPPYAVVTGYIIYLGV